MAHARFGISGENTVVGYIRHRLPHEGGIRHRLVTVPGGGHGNFTADQRLVVYAAIKAFLSKNGLLQPRCFQPAMQPGHESRREGN
jgi:hypothetical protein